VGSSSSIEWTDATWNPVAGCAAVSPGCTNCYAMRMAARLEAFGQEKPTGTTRKTGGRYKWSGKVVLDYGAPAIPETWRKGRRAVVNSMSDLFQEDVTGSGNARARLLLWRAALLGPGRGRYGVRRREAG
jgi:protein gp37